MVPVSLLAQATQPAGLPPLLDAYGLKLLTIAMTYVVTVATSGYVFEAVIGRNTPKADPEKTQETVPPPTTRQLVKPHQVIGKCENVIAITCVLFGKLDALGLVFGAKSLVRADDIKKDPIFYLGGTLVNLAWSLLLGLVCRLLVFGLPAS